MSKLIILNNDNNKEYKYNKNELNDKKTLTNIKHYLGVEFPPIPYLWHYDDFLQPYPVYGATKISIYKLRNMVNNKIENLNDLNDNNCDTYILAQYKKERFMYHENTNPNEIYLSYHTLLFNNLTRLNKIDNVPTNYKFKFLTGIYPLSGEYSMHKHYPFKNEKKKSFGGIPINSAKLESRSAVIHKHENHIKFSGINVCNFNILSDNAAFISIMKYPHLLVENNNRQLVKISQNKSNCVVLHLFRNVYDNNPDDQYYQELIKKYL